MLISFLHRDLERKIEMQIKRTGGGERVFVPKINDKAG